MPAEDRWRLRRAFVRWASGSAAIVGLSASVVLTGARTSARQMPPPPVHPTQTVINNYCISCHSQKARVGGLALEGLDASNPGSTLRSGNALSKSFAPVPCRRPDDRVPTGRPIGPRRTGWKLSSIARGPRAPSRDASEQCID